MRSGPLYRIFHFHIPILKKNKKCAVAEYFYIFVSGFLYLCLVILGILLFYLAPTLRSQCITGIVGTIMTGKPLNLSILVAEMDNSPPATPRSHLSNNDKRKSRIPLVSKVSMGPIGHVSKGVKTFRQWADPPPPPNRSRTLDRTSINTIKKRPGSADPRFHRSLLDTRITPQNDLHATVDKKQSSSVCDLTSPIIDIKEKINEYVEKPVNKIYHRSDFMNTATNEAKIVENIESNEMSRLITDFVESKPVEQVFENSHNYDGKLKNFESDETLHETQRTQTESKYSQTDMCTKDYSNNIKDIMLDANNETENDVMKSYVREKYFDDIMLNRRVTVNKLDSIVKMKQIQNNDYDSSMSRLLCKYNYWTYVEIWAALSFFTAILLFGWFYLLPYLSEALNWLLSPKPQMTASDYIRKSIRDICYSTFEYIYNIITIPANRRY